MLDLPRLKAAKRIRRQELGDDLHAGSLRCGGNGSRLSQARWRAAENADVGVKLDTLKTANA